VTNNKLLETFILHTVRKSIQREVLQELLRGFNLNYFKKLPTNTAKMNYAKGILPHMGEGSARTVYAASGDKVLKIAMNQKGIAQNKAEVDVFLEMDRAGFGNAVAKAIDYDPKYHWVLSEAVQPFDRGPPAEKAFEKGTGIPFSFFGFLLRNIRETPVKDIESISKNYRLSWDERIKLEDIAKNPPLILRALEYAMNHLNLVISDLTHVSHYGKTADGRVVLLDYGFTHDVEMWHYR